MKIRASEIIAGFITTIIFVVLLSYIFGIPNALPELPSVSKWIDGWKKEEPTKTAKKSTKVPNAKVVDNLNGVDIFYNGNVSTVRGRNVTSDGYNLGLRYQCVEFVKRYYYEYYNHKMPNSYGNAKDFFNPGLSDGEYNRDRGLVQFSNPSSAKPKTGDLIIYGPTQWNKFGHVAIISKVQNSRIQITQQNPGPNNPSREWIQMSHTPSGYFLHHDYVLGRLSRN